MADRSAPLSVPFRQAAQGLAATICGLLVVTVALGSELRETAIVKAVRNARGSVVNIRGEKTVPATASQPGQAESGRRVNGMGTGVVIDERGYVMTNHHVVDAVREIQVTLADQTRRTARLVARDPETDLAIIKLDLSESERLPVISIGTSSDLMVGEAVVAVGNAFGYDHTATRGIVSALHRAVQVSDAQFYEDLIQTDAAINPGNSGGPLLNIDGQMIGVNVAVRAGAQGIGFAIPVDKAMIVAAELMASTSGRKTWHGVALAKTESAGGVPVAAIEEKSPAEKAGFKPGDLITGVAGSKVERALDFHRALAEADEGQQLQVAVRRGEQALSLNLTLAKAQVQRKSTDNPYWDVLGLELKSIPSQEFRQQYQTRYRGGLLVAGVRPQSPAAEQGIRRGDVLVGMHIWETISLDNVTYILGRPDFSTLAPIKFFILRENETLYGFLPVAMGTSVTQR